MKNTSHFAKTGEVRTTAKKWKYYKGQRGRVIVKNENGMGMIEKEWFDKLPSYPIKGIKIISPNSAYYKNLIEITEDEAKKIVHWKKPPKPLYKMYFDGMTGEAFLAPNRDLLDEDLDVDDSLLEAMDRLGK